jgi:hypothetical protein
MHWWGVLNNQVTNIPHGVMTLLRGGPWVEDSEGVEAMVVGSMETRILDLAKLQGRTVQTRGEDEGTRQRSCSRCE